MAVTGVCGNIWLPIIKKIFVLVPQGHTQIETAQLLRHYF